MSKIKEHRRSYAANSGKFKGRNVVWVVTLVKDLFEPDSKSIVFKWFPNSRIIARGVSVCSPLELPDDERGITIARNHALRALKGRENLRPITNKRAIRTVMKTDCPFVNHLERAPTLTFHECRDLFNGEAVGKIMEQCKMITATRHPNVGITTDTIKGNLISNAMHL